MSRIQLPKRLSETSPYLFAEIDRIKKDREGKGLEIVDLSIGDPDIPTPVEIVEVAKEALGKPENHRYPTYEGMPALRETFANWFERRFGCQLNPTKEVIALIGSKDGIAHINVALVDDGDVVAVPDPAYPVYSTWAKFCGGKVAKIPLREENGFLPDLDDIPPTKILWLCYPNNPTSVSVSLDFYEKIVWLAKKRHFIILSDMAYSEIYSNSPPPSIFQVKDGKEVAVEFHSFSKTFCMTGWRIGIAAGREDIISALLKVKTNTDSGVFQAVQEAAKFALDNYETITPRIREIYKGRRKVMEEALEMVDFYYQKSSTTFYIWVKVGDSREFAKMVLEEHGLVVTPGIDFGEAGEGYVRLSLTTPHISKAARIIRGLKR